MGGSRDQAKVHWLQRVVCFMSGLWPTRLVTSAFISFFLRRGTSAFLSFLTAIHPFRYPLRTLIGKFSLHLWMTPTVVLVVILPSGTFIFVFGYSTDVYYWYTASTSRP